MPVKHFAFEGPDGCGKSTLVTNVVEALKAEGHNAIRTWHPGTTDIGCLLTRIIKRPEEFDLKRPCDLTIQLMMMADFAQFQIMLNKLDALEETIIVVSDRHNLISAPCYGTAADLKFEIFELLTQVIGPRRSSALFFVSCPDDVVRSRMTGRNLDSFESRNSDFHKAVAEAYQGFIRGNYSNYVGKIAERSSVLDGTKDPADLVREVKETILTIVGS